MDHFRSIPKASSTFPLTHGSPEPEPLAVPPFERWQSRKETDSITPDLESRRSSHRHFSDWSHLDGAKSPSHSHSQSHSYSRHKHSKSRELRFPRPMSSLASSASARGLLPTWSRDKDREGEDGLLRPITRETTRSRWGSDSTGVGSRRGSLLEVDQEQLGPIRRTRVQSMEDLEQVKKRRKQGEQYLRSVLNSVGTQATDVTRRLDYTYYSLLEKITALNSTIASFQDLSDSASTLLNDFERDTAGLDQGIRKQINDLRGFEPQIQKADALEKRMKLGRERVQDLGQRLNNVRSQIDHWEKRESEWQSRVSRRLRIFWATVMGALLVLVMALVLQNSPTHTHPPAQSNKSMWNETSLDFIPNLDKATDPSHSSSDTGSWYPSSLEDRQQSLAASITVTDAAAPTDDPLRVFDEL
ncbi:uncharacterized protein N7483_012867 [Penicillium malachiteum]|uniref:uncharacterized protein n=1 Tax=Penicillium malachiteum TaxID=1324776 RepID=UPI0025478B52|nr:uncharacterized protein N7483_012867 [Penicillium malachiteum]KAJ5715686.1 hypothetical protein N7483_012867 [Penicillium malachiteum]